MPAATFARRLIVRLNRLLKKLASCFDRLSTNGKSPTMASLPPFALSLSKGERKVFQHPAKEECTRGALRPDRTADQDDRPGDFCPPEDRISLGFSPRLVGRENPRLVHAR